MISAANSVILFSLLLVPLLAGVSGCFSDPEKLTELRGRTMGTTYSIKYLGDFSQQKAKKVVEDRLAQVNSEMNTWDRSSEISRLNRSGTEEHKVSADFFRVLAFNLSLAKTTGGVFDPTLGPLVNLWGFGPDGKRKVPASKTVSKVRSYTGFEKLEVFASRQSVRKKHDKVYVDLSASAKGFAVDAISLALKHKGIENLMVEIGGELRTLGRKGRADWLVGIDQPSEGRKKVLKLRDQSIATSGDYRNFFVEEGKRYSHTIDFRTGRPVENRLASVSVIAEDCMTADAWATALMALGLDRGFELAEREGLAAYFVYRQGDAFAEKSTPSFVKVEML